MIIEQIQLVHEAIREGQWIEAANLAFIADGSDVRVQNKREALMALRSLEKNLAESERYLEYAVLLWGNIRFDSRPKAARDVFDAVINNHKLIILGASSMSKCLGPDVPVMLYNGEIKPAKDIKKGDLLMGDDSTPRTVEEAHAGRGKMYRITPERGESWTCNDEHILSLRIGSIKMSGGSGLPSKKWVKGEIKDIAIKDYLKLSNDIKGRLKMFHVGVDFPEKPLPFDPYIYGAWIGDGGFDSGTLHTPDGPMAKRWMEYWDSFPNMRASKYLARGKCPMWRASKKKGIYKNEFVQFIRTSHAAGEKIILPEFLINSRKNRLKLLAGLLDSDGWLINKKTSYQFVARSKELAKQVSWLARSLGYASNVVSRVHTIKSIAFSAIYWHTGISGDNITDIPCLEKPAVSHVNKKALTNTSFKVEEIGEGDYNGFLIDGNHRFLLGDFTVTHNTYSCGVLFYLYWRSDPYWTAIKLAGPSEDHLYGNLFSHIVGLHKAAAIPMTDDDAKFIDINETEMSIGMHDAIPEMRIQCVLCKQNQISASGLRGHKPKPMRPYDHPKLGRMTRIYILIDEGTHVSPGAFEDIKTTEASINPNTDSVKIVMACNPEGIDYRIVQLAEPEGGWEVEQVDELFRWKSAKGYEVLRLDGKKSENVIERKIIYEGLLSYETFLDFLRSGEHSGPYWAKGRGFPPLKDNAWTIVPPAWMQSQRGEPVYVGSVKNIGMHDTALGGSDKALFGIGRWGEASGWMDFKGNVTPFTDRTNPALKITKHVAVLDQIFQLPKSDSTVEIMQEIMGRCKMMGIPAENLAMDKTGNASGVWSHAKTYWGDVLGVDFGTKADESKVVSEDMHNAYDLYDGKVTELWFAMKRWMDPTVSALLISPIVPTSPMFSHITTRRYRNVKGGRVRVEPKQEYKARNQGVSPDEADILCLLVEWCRQRGGVLPGIVEKRETDTKIGERVSSQNADEPDNLDGQEWVGNSLEVL